MLTAKKIQQTKLRGIIWTYGMFDHVYHYCKGYQTITIKFWFV